MKNFIEQLCPNCGLCCDSTLFADVELQKGDDAKSLAKNGLKIFLKTKGKSAFSQPCNCFDGKFCRIYSDRPKRCQLFECGLLRKTAANEMTPGAALKKISEAKILAEKVRALLRESGNEDEQMPLTNRYSQTMSAPIDLAGNNSELRGELMLAVADLMQKLQGNFLE